MSLCNHFAPSSPVQNLKASASQRSTIVVRIVAVEVNCEILRTEVVMAVMMVLAVAVRVEVEVVVGQVCQHLTTCIGHGVVGERQDLRGCRNSDPCSRVLRRSRSRNGIPFLGDGCENPIQQTDVA